MASGTEFLVDDPLWYKDAIIYQVHIKSFFDANNDGVGDFPGLIAKLDHQMLFRAVQVIRRLQIKNREVGVFCNISPTTLNDPMVSEEHITAFGWASPQEIDEIMSLALRINDFLVGLFLGVGIRLVDFKMECGRLFENEMMRIIVADEISPDSCRLWDIKSNEKLDKDRFRRDLGGLLEAYTEVARRLGIIGENERPAGAGPVLVKS